MTISRSTKCHFTLSATLLAALGGCAATPQGSTVAVMPGPGKTFESFQADNASCKTFAGDQVKGQADAANQRAAGAGALTTVLGTGLGAATGAIFGNAGAGAGVGAVAGAGTGTAIGTSNSSNDQASIQQQYDIAFSQCMYARGDRVPGYTIAAAPTSAAAPDPLVRATQSELIRLGYLKGSADGFMGQRTRTAIADFEQANGMSADGNPSQRLLARLQSAPSNAPVANAAAPSNWVAPTGSANAAPQPTAAPSGWVTPAKAP